VEFKGKEGYVCCALSRMDQDRAVSRDGAGTDIFLTDIPTIRSCPV
jgi:hypothetical protein